MADSEPLRFQTDRHHFDNPAYSYTGRAAGNGATVCIGSDDGSLLPLNNMHKKIHNNLGSKNNLNIERQRAGCSTEDDDDLCSKGILTFLICIVCFQFLGNVFD